MVTKEMERTKQSQLRFGVYSIFPILFCCFSACGADGKGYHRKTSATFSAFSSNTLQQGKTQVVEFVSASSLCLCVIIIFLILCGSAKRNRALKFPADPPQSCRPVPVTEDSRLGELDLISKSELKSKSESPKYETPVIFFSFDEPAPMCHSPRDATPYAVTLISSSHKEKEPSNPFKEAYIDLTQPFHAGTPDFADNLSDDVYIELDQPFHVGIPDFTGNSSDNVCMKLDQPFHAEQKKQIDIYENCNHGEEKSDYLTPTANVESPSTHNQR